MHHCAPRKPILIENCFMQEQEHQMPSKQRTTKPKPSRHMTFRQQMKLSASLSKIEVTWPTGKGLDLTHWPPRSLQQQDWVHSMKHFPMLAISSIWLLLPTGQYPKMLCQFSETSLMHSAHEGWLTCPAINQNPKSNTLVQWSGCTLDVLEARGHALTYQFKTLLLFILRSLSCQAQLQIPIRISLRKTITSIGCIVFTLLAIEIPLTLSMTVSIRHELSSDKQPPILVKI